MDVGAPLPLPSINQGLKSFLKTRRSNLAKVMSEPGPRDDQISEFLEIAMRVPDHRKLAPWRFVVFQGEARSRFGDHLADAFAKAFPEMPQDRVEFERSRFLRAPVVIAVISSPVVCPRGTPEWEQILSSGVACYNLCLAAQSEGFGAQWLTEWYAYDDYIGEVLELSTDERIAGFIYIGSVNDVAMERTRPESESKVSYW